LPVSGPEPAPNLERTMETQQQKETTERRGEGSDSTGLVMPRFRAWLGNERAPGSNEFMVYSKDYSAISKFFREFEGRHGNAKRLMKSMDVKDRLGNEIFEGDVLRFSDKWEWYRCQYGPKFMFSDDERREELKKQFEAEPYEERVIKGIEDFEWLLSSEIQSYWEIIGNIHEAPELLIRAT